VRCCSLIVFDYSVSRISVGFSLVCVGLFNATASALSTSSLFKYYKKTELNMLYLVVEHVKIETILCGGSLGSWIDEEHSKL
jgi:hypothetical protein